MKKGHSQTSGSGAKTRNATLTKGATYPSDKANTLTVMEEEGKSRERRMAELNLSPVVANTITARTFGRGTFGEIDLTESISVMREKTEKVKAGDLSDVEATLTAQATTLDAMFNELARRAALNMGEYLSAAETYLRLALKTQAQCRATLETLSDVKYPKAPTFVRQQNVAYQQQVNNGGSANGNLETSTRVHAHEKLTNCDNELLEERHDKRLDTRAKSTASTINPEMATLGAVNRAKDAAR